MLGPQSSAFCQNLGRVRRTIALMPEKKVEPNIRGLATSLCFAWRYVALWSLCGHQTIKAGS